MIKARSMLEYTGFKMTKKNAGGYPAYIVGGWVFS